MNSIRELVSGATLTVMIDSIMVVVGGVILFLQDTFLFSVCLVIVVLYAVIVLAFKSRLYTQNELVMENNAQLSSGLVETLQGIQTVKSFHAEQKMNKKAEVKFEKLMKSVYKLNMDINLQTALKGFIELLSGILILWLGAYKVINQQMFIGGLITFNAILVYFLTPVKNLIDLQSQIQTAIIAAERAAEIMDLEVEEKENVEKEKMKFKEIKNSIKIKNLSFRYGKRTLVLENVSLNIHKGQRVAFVGESGSGKTTLAKLLLNFYQPEQGSIKFDSNFVSSFSLKSLRTRIAYVPQETFLLSDTILENLLLGEKDIEMEEVYHVANITKIADFVDKYPLKYDTKLDENGMNLSGGQRQRIAIARALLQKPELLILDESTSNLDVITEECIQQSINNFNPQMTIIIIAHRLSTIKDCDRIFVFEKGKLIEQGTHDELLKQSGYYFALNSRNK